MRASSARQANRWCVLAPAATRGAAMDNIVMFKSHGACSSLGKPKTLQPE